MGTREVNRGKNGHASAPGAASNSGINLTVARKLLDPEWDDFVASIPSGDHLQSSLWAAFKRTHGWSPVRVVAARDGRIVGGAQVLERRMLGTFKIGHILQGPVIGHDEHQVFPIVLDGLIGLVKASRIRYLAVQPPPSCGYTSDLGHWGIRESTILAGERATVILDLSQNLDALMSGMRRTTRNNIGLAREQDVEVHQGDSGDLAGFHRLLEATGRRRHFTPESLEYCRKMWRSFERANGLQLFLAEHDGDLLSGLLAVPFGRTVAMKMLGWSGSKGWLRPNEFVIWSAIEWAKEHGFERFDFCGIDVAAAHELAAGRPLPESEHSTITRFKMGFGGAVVLIPPTYEYVSNAAIRRVSRRLFPAFGGRDITQLARRFLSAGLLGREHRWPRRSGYPGEAAGL